MQRDHTGTNGQSPTRSRRQESDPLPPPPPPPPPASFHYGGCSPLLPRPSSVSTRYHQGYLSSMPASAFASPPGPTGSASSLLYGGAAAASSRSPAASLTTASLDDGGASVDSMSRSFDQRLRRLRLMLAEQYAAPAPVPAPPIPPPSALPSSSPRSFRSLEMLRLWAQGNGEGASPGSGGSAVREETFERRLWRESSSPPPPHEQVPTPHSHVLCFHDDATSSSSSSSGGVLSPVSSSSSSSPGPSWSVRVHDEQWSPLHLQVS
jgi:hypothetical protein